MAPAPGSNKMVQKKRKSPISEVCTKHYNSLEKAEIIYVCIINVKL